tara:strand:- start:40 stop:225 length:186 start_codon:yes stop_codon:yes gene_type:complete
MQKKVIHEHKLSRPLTIILGIIAFGIVMNAIDMYLISDALAELGSGDVLNVRVSGGLSVYQ